MAGDEPLVARLHAAVGGPAALATYDDPASVRDAVLSALAAAQPDAASARRVARNDLTATERRAVRTVTNRGAAVRSRARQRRELTRLREELRAKTARLARLEAALASLAATVARSQIARPQNQPDPFSPVSPAQQACRSLELPMRNNRPALLPPPYPPRTSGAQTTAPSTLPPPEARPPPAPSHTPPAPPAPPPAVFNASTGFASHTTPVRADMDVSPNTSLDFDVFGNMIDHLISPRS